MQQYNFLLFVVLTVLCVRSAHSCMCDITHPQNKFCSADFGEYYLKVFLFCLHKTFLRGVFFKIHLKRKYDIQVHSKILRQFHRCMMDPFKASLSVTFWVNVEGLWITQLVTHLSVSLDVIASMSVSINLLQKSLSFWPYGIISIICYNGKAYLLLSFNMFSWI